MISDISLDRLDLSPLNPRRTPPSDEAIEAFAESILARLETAPDSSGLIQNLTVHQIEDDRFGVADGGQRWRALKLLAERGAIAADQPIPCMVETRDIALTAGAANINRRPLGPVDEFRAYAAQVTAGHNVEQIAAAFAVAPRDVHRRLKLASVHPDILAAFQAGHIDAKTLEAFTITDDQARQLKVFNSEAEPRRLYANVVRVALSPKGNNQTLNGLGFIGRDAYLAAGGRLTEDLFSDHLVIHDPEIVRDLVAAKLADACEARRAEGWSWIEALPAYDWNALNRYPARLPQKTAAARAVAGVVIWPERDGEIRESAGHVRQDDFDRAVEAGLLTPAPTTAPGGGDKNPDHSRSLLEELRALHGLAVRTALLAKPDLALDVLTLHLEVGRAGLLSEAFPETRAPAEGYGALTIDPRLARPAAGGDADLVVLQAAGRKARNGALTAAVARRLVNHLAGENAAFDQVADQAAPDRAAALRAVWTPDAAFFRRFKTDQLVAIFEELAEKPPSECGVEAKKAALVETLGKLFADPKLAAAYPTAGPKLARWIPAPLRDDA